MCSIFYPGEIFLENASCYRVIALHTRRSVCVLPNHVLPGKPRACVIISCSTFSTQIMAIETIVATDKLTSDSLMSSPSMCVQLFTAFEEAILKLYMDLGESPRNKDGHNIHGNEARGKK